jgi:hypothetical protein
MERQVEMQLGTDPRRFIYEDAHPAREFNPRLRI